MSTLLNWRKLKRTFYRQVIFLSIVLSGIIFGIYSLIYLYNDIFTGVDLGVSSNFILYTSSILHTALALCIEFITAYYLVFAIKDNIDDLNQIKRNLEVHEYIEALEQEELKLKEEKS